MSDPSINNQEELLKNVAEGDELAFARLMKQYANLLATFVYRLTKNRELTEEIVQDTFLKIWQTRESLAEVQNFTTFLYVISRNRALNALRTMIREKKRMMTWEQQQPVSDHVSSEYSPDEKFSLLEKAIDQLPPQQKEAWLLSRREGLKYTEIATLMDLSRETVKKYIRYASLSITRYFEDHIHLVLSAVILIGL